MPESSARERIVDAAFDLFAERGYDATTVEDIAARAGVGRTTFFRQFRSKEHVVFPDHEQLLTAIAARLATATPRTAVVGVSEAAGLVLQHYLDEGERARRRYRLTRSVPALQERERAGIRQYERTFNRHIHGWLGGAPESLLRAELIANAVVTGHNHVLRAWLRGQLATASEARRAFRAAMAEVESHVDVPGREAAAPAEALPAVLVLRDAGDLDRLLPQIRDLLG
ncbi:TetR family transcriptional regulator [Nocardioides sp. IC4_145]|uniref:TetR family transcriptional regulator n=1 Tax=Nocardioides sp. IC4_145 TaxID=2714037 RepID=UPI00140D0FB8|nr:TetR family transcriptional regulator [Nocardioides sp. IC4_145]